MGWGLGWKGKKRKQKGRLERGLFNLLKPWQDFKRKYTCKYLKSRELGDSIRVLE